jgi:hypothetical protein
MQEIRFSLGFCKIRATLLQSWIKVDSRLPTCNAQPLALDIQSVRLLRYYYVLELTLHMVMAGMIGSKYRQLQEISFNVQFIGTNRAGINAVLNSRFSLFSYPFVCYWDLQHF